MFSVLFYYGDQPIYEEEYEYEYEYEYHYEDDEEDNFYIYCDYSLCFPELDIIDGVIIYDDIDNPYYFSKGNF